MLAEDLRSLQLTCLEPCAAGAGLSATIRGVEKDVF